MNRIIGCFIFASMVTSVTVADEETSGHVDVSVRTVDTSGEKRKYRQYVNLDSGVRLTSLAVVVKPKDRKHLPDLLDLRLAGLGGDPFERAALTVKKIGKYQFKYDRHKSDYFYEDLLLRPEDASVEHSTGGDFHHFDFERVRDRGSFKWMANDRTTLALDFNGYTKRGNNTTTLDVEREEFELNQPVDESLAQYRITLQHDWDHISLIVSERWHEYDNRSAVFLPDFSVGLEPDAPTELDYFFLDQPYGYDGREHTLKLQGALADNLRFSVNAIDFGIDLDVDARERSQGLNFLGTPFVRDVSGAGGVERDTLLLDSAVDYAFSDQVEVGVRVNRRSLIQDGAVMFEESPRSSAWDIENNGLEFAVRWQISPAFRVASGWTWESRDHEFRYDSSDLQTERTERNGLYLRFDYRPHRRASLMISIEDNGVDDPFTSASATENQRARVRGRYLWENGLGVDVSYGQTWRDNANSNWRSVDKQTSLRLSQTLDRLTFSLGISEIDVEREIDQLVTGGFRQDLFAITYQADARFVDGSLNYQLDDKVDLSLAVRRYDNDGSFSVERDDLRASVAYRLAQNYLFRMAYRNVDYEEDTLEKFDADIWELSFRFNW